MKFYFGCYIIGLRTGFPGVKVMVARRGWAPHSWWDRERSFERRRKWPDFQEWLTYRSVGTDNFKLFINLLFYTSNFRLIFQPVCIYTHSKWRQECSFYIQSVRRFKVLCGKRSCKILHEGLLWQLVLKLVCAISDY